MPVLGMPKRPEKLSHYDGLDRAINIVRKKHWGTINPHKCAIIDKDFSKHIVIIAKSVGKEIRTLYRLDFDIYGNCYPVRRGLVKTTADLTVSIPNIGVIKHTRLNSLLSKS